MSDHQPHPRRDPKAISEHEVILFMKGRPEQPMCGFSARTVAALDALSATYAAVDILPDPRIRQELSAISNWPTIPQLFVNGELVGGCDIVTEMYETGELAADARHRAARERARRGPGGLGAGRPAPPDPQRPRLAPSSPGGRGALAVAPAGDRNEHKRAPDRAEARRRVPAMRAAQHFAVHAQGHRRLRRDDRGRPDSRFQRRPPVPLREREQGDADGRRAAARPLPLAHGRRAGAC